jgi:hypothetical protein
MQLESLPAALRAKLAALINPIYHELVLMARPGLAQSTGLTIVHLMWLEILDQIEIARKQYAPDPSNDPQQLVAYVSKTETRVEMIERHLRLVHAKLKASDFLLRLNEFGSSFWQSYREPSPSSSRSNFSGSLRHAHGKSDFC